MASLLERIEQLGAGGAQPQQRGIERVLRQKGGRARQRTGPAATTLGEQAAITAGQQALREQTFAERLAGVQTRGREQALTEQQELQQRGLRQQEQLAQERLAAEAAVTREGLRAGEEEARLRGRTAEERKIREINVQAEQRLRDLTSQRNLKLDDIFAQYEFDTAELEDRRDGAQLEQQAFLLAMQDRKYLEELDRIGQERQLQNDIEFDREMQRIIYGDSLDGLLKEMDFKAGRNAKNREYTQQLSQIDFETAVALSRAAIRDDAERTKWESIGNIDSAVIPQAAGTGAKAPIGGKSQTIGQDIPERSPSQIDIVSRTA
jgi:hypothetical protein